MQALAQSSQSLVSSFCSTLRPHGSLQDLTASTQVSLQHLARFLGAQAQLDASLAAAAPPSSRDTEEQLCELRSVAQKRHAALDHLAEELDQAVQGMRGLLDECHALLETRATTVEPEEIIRYAHRLRFAFHPLGAPRGLPADAPAPQPNIMLASNLNQFHREQQQEEARRLEEQRAAAAQQRLQQEQMLSVLRAFLPAGWKPGDDIPEDVMQRMLQMPVPGAPPDGAAGAAAGGAAAAAAANGEPLLAPPPGDAAAAVAAAAAAQQPPPAAAAAPLNLGLALNVDLAEEDLGSDWEQVQEELSEEDMSDDY